MRLSNPQNAVSSLYTLYAISACLKVESDLDFGKYFNNEQLKWYESVTVVEDFYKKGPSLTTTDITSNIMAPLVKDMINSVEIINESAGVFRFAHAETMIPLATFLELKTANTSTNNPDKVMSIWEIKSISPMAANVQWILYDNGSNKLIKMLYNEVEMSFPVALKPVTGVYYHWADVKDYYTQKIESLGFNMSNTMEEDLDYLKSHY